MDKHRFAAAMAALGEAFSQEATKEKIKIYYKALSDLTIEQVETAVWSLIRTRTTASFPKIAEIREHISGSLEERALLAVAEIGKTMQEYGPDVSVMFVDPVIHAVIENYPGGWPALDVTMKEWSFTQKKLIDLYKAMAPKVTNHDCQPLLGNHDRNNIIGGYRERVGRNLVKVGFDDIAQLTHEGQKQLK